MCVSALQRHTRSPFSQSCCVHLPGNSCAPRWAGSAFWPPAVLTRSHLLSSEPGWVEAHILNSYLKCVCCALAQNCWSDSNCKGISLKASFLSCILVPCDAVQLSVELEFDTLSDLALSPGWTLRFLGGFWWQVYVRLSCGTAEWVLGGWVTFCTAHCSFLVKLLFRGHISCTSSLTSLPWL